MKSFVFVLKLLLVLAMLAFIWGHSMMPASVSVLESGRFLQLVEPLVEKLQGFLEERGMSFTQDYLVRKMAHFAEFAVLGFLMLMLFLPASMRCRVILPALACAAAAFVDEGIQLFAEGRGPALRDVALDFSGACAGMALGAAVTLLLYWLIRPDRRGRGHKRTRKR